jgi:hypothetical protein
MQTNNLLATGGVMQEGGTKDPISGNDVPAGALKEEVRDDVPAQLSPGEFVFPADVTRYIGLDKLMQIRDAAKEGLQEMESKGQMGNAEEVAADDSGNEDKFSSHIDEIIAGLDKGEGNTKKFATGGSVNSTDYSAAPIRGFKMVQYEDVETKTVKYIPFINGKPLLPIPAGYTEKKTVSPITPPTTATPPTTGPVDVITDLRMNRGRSEPSETTPSSGTVNDAGVQGFGDIQGGTNPNIARVAGFVAGLANPFVGLLVSAAGSYATKENNKKVAEANAKAVDASSLAQMGFTAADIKAAQDAVAKATLEGKSAKDIAVAAANAAGTSDPNSPKTTLDALIGITNGWNTAKPEVMKADAMPDSLKEKVPVGTWDTVVAAIKDGLTPEQAVEKAVKVMDTTVGSYFTGTVNEKEVTARLAAEGLEGKVPAGEFNNVVNDMKDGYTPQQAVARAEERAVGPTDSQLAEKDAQMRQEAKDNADKVQAERNAEVAKQEADRTAQKEAADRTAKEAADRAAQQAAQDAADRASQQAEKDAQTARDAQAGAESRDSSSRSGGGGGNWGAGGNWGGNSLSHDTGGESGGAG